MHTASDKRSRPSITSLIAFAIVVIAGYVLSPGPYWILNDAGYIDDRIVSFCEDFFGPLVWCYDNLEWVKWFYDGYSDLVSSVERVVSAGTG